MRRFEIVKGYENKGIELPVRQTKLSAGYDLASCEDVLIKAGEIKMIPTGLRVKMLDNEVLLVYPRSSLAIKKGLMMSNGVGVIDADYYHAENLGHISIPVYNFTKEDVLVKSGERISQGIFTSFLKTSNDKDSNNIVRLGGFGSSGI
jgi:dUTP pyrophosphatase